MAALERGGNAFDAAVVGGFVLQVVEPHLNGPGGEVPLMLWSEKERRSRVICGQGSAPDLATIEYFRSLGLHQVPGIGLLPATVPGAFGAWLTMLRDYGTMTLREALSPAINYADNGFPLIGRAVQAILAVEQLFRDEWKTSERVWLPDGRVPKPNSIFRNRQLAKTYKKIIVDAEAMSKGSRESVINAALDVWYRGYIAKEIDEYYRTARVKDTTGERNGGLLRFEDLECWEACYEQPLTADFGEFTVAKCGPWSQGPMFLQQLSILKNENLRNATPERFVHVIAESAKLSFADRLAWYGDPDYADVPINELLSDAYGAARYVLIERTASQELRPGSPGGRAPNLPDLSVSEKTLRESETRFGIGEPTFVDLPPIREWAEREVFVGDTCHLSVIDAEGNMVSATPSGGWLSSSPVIPSLGFSLNTRLQMTWLDVVPSQLAARKRPLTTLSPGMAFKNGEPYMVFGTPGGDQQDQWTVAFFIRHAVLGMNLQEAIDAPSWHVDHSPASFWPRSMKLNNITVEQRMDERIIGFLKEAGHCVTIGDSWSEGRISACTRERDESGRLVLRAGANARGMQGYAVGR
jgi:gamma-glutamyltranspeptidase/glutathione hydrolase